MWLDPAAPTKYVQFMLQDAGVGILLTQARFVPICFSWRPISPDPGDDHVIDCAMNAGVPVVTSNVGDFRRAEHLLGLVVSTPVDFVTRLAEL